MSSSAAANEAPERIGPYRILDQLGEGGMGVVYLAEQTEPVARRVALKLIKRGMDSAAVVARFAAERAALARMEHPGIAKVYDAGIAPSGQPFIALEYVPGIPLTDFCDRRRLTIAQRLALFVRICAAVQHGHQKGVLHRDLKPANVLVLQQDGTPTPKIIDWGLAKALDEPLSDATLLTEPGQVVGTPEYMSPEQARLGGFAIDTRADVYALGAVLYQLLTGELPFARSQLRGVDRSELRRVICEIEPRAPSQAVRMLGAAADPAAGSRACSAAELQRNLRGDLDWIVLRALEKDPERRYQSARELAQDVERHLRHEPVLASPPSTIYRTRRFVRRNRLLVGAAAVVLVTAAVGAVVALGQYRSANTSAAIAADKVREFRQVSGVLLLERAVAAARDLVPAWPERIPAMEAWLAGDVQRLLNQREELTATIASLRTLALPWTAEEQAADRSTHPRAAAFAVAQQHRAELEDEQAFRSGTRPFVEAPLTREEQRMPLGDLLPLIQELTSPDPEQRRQYRQLERGVALTRAALAKATDDRMSQRLLEALALALAQAGQDAQAQEMSLRAAELSRRTALPLTWGASPLVPRYQKNHAERLRQAERAEQELDQVLAQRRTWSFASDRSAERFLHDTLVRLLADIESLATQQRPDVLRRLRWAKELRDGKLSLAHPLARQTWAEARAAIQQNPRYRDAEILLRDEDLHDLVPIGENPVTHLFECYHLPSAWDGVSDPRTIRIPAHEPDGSIRMDGDTGIVFVLLPGGKVLIGAQSANPSGPNYSRMAKGEHGPVQTATLAPFFLARHELSQGQWARLYGPTGPRRFPSTYSAGIGGDVAEFSLANPVESIGWPEADQVMRDFGLELPLAAQWEYAARGGTQTGYWCGDDPASLHGNENVLDPSVLKLAPAMRKFELAPLDDGFIRHAPIGSLHANPFGLHDMLGNVTEWGGDAVRDSITLKPGVKVQTNPDLRQSLGGSFSHPPSECLPSDRGFNMEPGVARRDNGLRAARALHPGR